MKLVKLNEGESIIDPSTLDKQIDIYILASGKIKLSKYSFNDLALEEKDALTGQTDMLTHKMNSRIILPPELFGDCSALGWDTWNGLYAYAFEGPADLISIDYSLLKAFYKRVTETREKIDFTDFLNIAIPGFSGRLLSSKEKIGKCFFERKFVAGTIIANEGAILNEAYIIKKG